MGVYNRTFGLDWTGLNNGKPVWERHDGTENIYYSNEGKWMIGPDTSSGGISTVESNLQTWPDQVTRWQYANDKSWHSDDQLSVKEGRPEYPESLTIKDKTGDSPQLEGVYRRQNDSLVWRYGDYEISYNGKFWRITDDNGEETNIYGWDYSEDYNWPDTDTLYIIDFPDFIDVTMSGSAAREHRRRIGRYHMESNNSAQLRPVYKKPEGLFSRDYYIFYNRQGRWAVSDDVTEDSAFITSEQIGLISPPSSGWQYTSGSVLFSNIRFVNDDTIIFTWSSKA